MPLNISMGGQHDRNVAEKIIVTNGRSYRAAQTTASAFSASAGSRPQVSLSLCSLVREDTLSIGSLFSIDNTFRTFSFGVDALVRF